MRLQCLVGLLALLGLAGPAVAVPPNFIIILADDLGWADLGCYGSKFHETPRLDKMAKEGVRCTDAYAACNVCSPTRASIMTGKYPARLHITTFIPGRPSRDFEKLLAPKWQQFLPLDEATLPKMLKPAGYTSASVGKWHLGGPDYSPEKHGFDLNVTGAVRGSPPGYFAPYNVPKGGPAFLPDSKEEEYLTDRLTDEALKFIDKNKDRPFFLYLPHYAPHIPLQAKKDKIAKFQAKARPQDGQNNPVYAAMLESLDESVGRILDRLDELKIADNTIVVFTSDNGGLSVREGPTTPATSNAPLRASKGYNYEGGLRVPLLVRWPSVLKAGSVVDTPVFNMDLYPTFLELAGVKPDAKQVVDAVSLVSLLKGGAPPKRDHLFWHFPHYTNQGGKPGGAVRQGDWKLVEHYEAGGQELYNLKDDLSEDRNLAAKHPDKVKELAKLLNAWRTEVKAQMPTPNPDYKRPAP